LRWNCYLERAGAGRSEVAPVSHPCQPRHWLGPTPEPQGAAPCTFASIHALALVNDVVATIDIQSFPCNQPGCVVREERCRDADIIDAHEAAGRSFAFGFLEQLIEFRNSRCSPGCEWSRGNRMNADALGPQFGSHVTHGRLQRRLGNTHDVVVLYDH